MLKLAPQNMIRSLSLSNLRRRKASRLVVGSAVTAGLVFLAACSAEDDGSNSGGAGAPAAGAPVAGAPVAGAPVAGAPVAGAPVAGAPVGGATGGTGGAT